MVGRQHNQWKVFLVVAACMAIPLLAVVLLVLVADIESFPRGKTGVIDSKMGAEHQMGDGSDRKQSGTPPMTIKINSWTDVLRTFYYDFFYPPEIPNGEPVFSGVRNDDGSMKSP
jgi:hypothetical protein